MCTLAMTWIRVPAELNYNNSGCSAAIVSSALIVPPVDHLGIDPAIGMAEPALQRLRDGKVALRPYPDRH